MDRLPTEIAHEICRYLSPEDLCNVRHVNRAISDVATMSLFRSIQFWIETASLQKLQAVTANQYVSRYTTKIDFNTQEYGQANPDLHQNRPYPWDCSSGFPVPCLNRLGYGGEMARNGPIDICACKWIDVWLKRSAHQGPLQANRDQMIKWMLTWQMYFSDQINLRLQQNDIDIMTRALKKLPLLRTVSINNTKTPRMVQMQHELGFEFLLNPSPWRGRPFNVLMRALSLLNMRPTTLEVLSDKPFGVPYGIISQLPLDNPIPKSYMPVFEALIAIDFCWTMAVSFPNWRSTDRETAFTFVNSVMEHTPLLESLIFRICRQDSYEGEEPIYFTELHRLWRFKNLKVLILEGLDGIESEIVELLGRHRSLKEVGLSNVRLYHGTWASILNTLRSLCFENLRIFCLHQVYDCIRQVFNKQELQSRFGWDERSDEEFWLDSSNEQALDYVIGKIDFNPIEAQTENWRRRDLFPQSPPKHIATNDFGCFSQHQRA